MKKIDQDQKNIEPRARKTRSGTKNINQRPLEAEAGAVNVAILAQDQSELHLAPGATQQKDSSPQTTAIRNLVLLTKNVNSAQTDKRFSDLCAELDACRWDIFTITETWRADREEITVLSSGHLFLGP